MKHKLAFVTGASSGIGREIARLLAKLGVALILTARNREALLALAAELSPLVDTKFFVADLKCESEREELLEKMKDLAVDLVINAAGLGLYGEAISHAVEEEMTLVDVNVKAPVEFSLYFLKKWKERGQRGVIVNIASALGFFSAPCHAVYAASKAFLIKFSSALDAEMRGSAIRVLTSCPGQVESEFATRAAGRSLKLKNAMTAQRAASAILWQIKREKSLHIFDWRYRLLVAFSQLFPRSLSEKCIEKSIKRRIHEF